MRRISSNKRLAGVFCASAMLCFAVSCDKGEEITPDGNDDEPIVTEEVPSVRITPGESGEDYLTFTLLPENAAQARYMVLPESEQMPDATAIMNEGEEAEPSAEKEYTVSGLTPSTAYVVLAAARNSDGLTSVVARAEMITGEHVPIVPEVTISDIAVDGTSAGVTYTLKDAVEAWYLCLPASDEAPSAEQLSADGSDLPLEPSSPLSISNLEYETSYVFYAAAQSVDEEYSQVASFAFETGEVPVTPPAVGDYYYSDGTWSTGSEAPVEGKTVVGIVFKSGASDSDLSDYSATGISRINGFAVALNDVKDNSDIFFPKSAYKFSDTPLGITSTDADDFSGYYNTSLIIDAAENDMGGLSGSNCAAVYYATEFYETQAPAPESSTGWYLPSLGQLKELYNVKATVYASMDMAGGSALYDFSGDWYWSSTEADGTSGESVWKVSFQDSGLLVESDKISKLWSVRPVLAF